MKANDLQELSNQELIEMRDHAYDAELRMQKVAWMHDTKLSLSKRVTSISNELCRRLAEGTIVFDDEGNLSGDP
tara:strand:+ start:307 stop:528 length:222 start_codon:yes stop_codon:yes gene_type:complete